MSFVAETGYDGVEIAPFTLAPHVTDVPASERTRLRQEAAEAGIEISGIHWVLVGTEGMHMTSPDESVRRRTAQYFCDLVDFCADLGGESIIVGSPHQRNLDDDTPLEIGLDRAREVFRASLKRAEDKGVTVCFEPLAPSETNFIKTAINETRKAQGLEEMPANQMLKKIKEKAQLLDIDTRFLSRSLNDGFSGGEKKRNEIFQMAMLEPKLAILDETDSGLDIDALRVVANGVNTLRNKDNAIIVITHYQRLLDYIVPDFVHVLHEGKIVKSGTKELALEFEEKGYDWIKQAI